MDKLLYYCLFVSLFCTVGIGFLAGCVGHYFGFGFWPAAILAEAVTAAFLMGKIASS